MDVGSRSVVGRLLETESLFVEILFDIDINDDILLNVEGKSREVEPTADQSIPKELFRIRPPIHQIISSPVSVTLLGSMPYK